MSDKYAIAVRALVRLVHSLGEHTRPPVFFLHGYENNLDAIPDMLARLGVMKADTVGHAFTVDWDPSGPLNIVRHPGEPKLSDLGIGIDFAFVWYCSGTYYERKQPIIPLLFQQELIKAAVELGRGEIIDGTYLPYDGRGDNLIEDYWVSRSEKINELGSEQKLYPETSG